MVQSKRRRIGVNPVRVLNGMRRELSLPTVTESKPVKITREVMRQVCIEVWKKYPQSLTQVDYQLGELTLALVD